MAPPDQTSTSTPVSKSDSNAKSHPTSPPLGLTFRQIIDADHSQINRLAARVRRALASLTADDTTTTTTTASASSSLSSTISNTTPTTPATLSTSSTHTTYESRSTHHLQSLQSLRSLLLTLLTRLIRHDFSESLVMRPALTAHYHLSTLAQHDKADHDRAKHVLLAGLYSLSSHITSLQSQNSDSSSNAVIVSAPASVFDLHDLTTRIVTVFNDLLDHMAWESGSLLPRFEAEITLTRPGWSAQLAEGYADTLIMVPEMLLRGEKAWSGVEAFVSADVAVLEDVFVRLKEERDRGVDGGEFERVRERQVAGLRGEMEWMRERERAKKEKEKQKEKEKERKNGEQTDETRHNCSNSSSTSSCDSTEKQRDNAKL